MASRPYLTSLDSIASTCSEIPHRQAARRYVSPRGRALTPKETETRRLAYALKEIVPDLEVLRVAANEMAELVPLHAELVPIPSSSGDTTANRHLAAAIAGHVAGRVVEALRRRAPVESSRLRRFRGAPRLALSEHGFEPTEHAATLQGEPVFIDNVTTSGRTFAAARIALGRGGFGVAFAIVGEPTVGLVSEPSGAEALPVPPVPRSPDTPWFHDPAAIRRLARGGRSPTALENARSKLPRVPDDQLLNAIEGFATLILTNADLPPHVGSLSLDDLLVELTRRGTRATQAGRLMSLAGEAERLTRLAEREAALEEPEEAASRLGKVLYQVRSELGRRLERLLRRTLQKERVEENRDGTRLPIS